MCVVAVYVDDIIIGCESETEINDIKSVLSLRFEMKDLGSLKYFLGVNVIQNIEEGNRTEVDALQTLLCRRSRCSAVIAETVAEVALVQKLMSCRRSCAAEVDVVQTLLRRLQKLLSCKSLCRADVAVLQKSMSCRRC